MSAIDTQQVIEVGDFIRSSLSLRRVGFVTKIEERDLGPRKQPWTIRFYTIDDANGFDQADAIDQGHAVLVAKSEAWWERFAAEVTS